LYWRDKGLVLIEDVLWTRIRTDEYEDVLGSFTEAFDPFIICTENITYGKVYGQQMEAAGYRVEYAPRASDKVAWLAQSQYAKWLRNGWFMFPSPQAGELPPDWFVAYRDEATPFPDGRHDDILDAFGSITWLIEEFLPPAGRRKLAHQYEQKEEQEQPDSYTEWQAQLQMEDIAKEEREHSKTRMSPGKARNRRRYQAISRRARTGRR
jgi:hypothetical protein